MLDDIQELKELISANLDITELMDILDLSIYELLDLLEEQIEEREQELRRACR